MDLSSVKKIILSQGHEPFFYSPFNTTMLNPVMDQTVIEIEDDFQFNKQVVFKKFMGFLSEVQPIHYTVLVLIDEGVLRTFDLSSSLKNNLQLAFRGELLQGALENVLFQITKNENWDGENNVGF